MSHPRRWRAGETIRRDGIDFRVERGDKFDGDLVIEWHTQHGWKRISNAVIGILIDFVFENEDARYGRETRAPGEPRRGPRGGYKVLDFAQHAAFHGWQSAIRKQNNERISKHRAQRDVRRAMEGK